MPWKEVTQSSCRCSTGTENGTGWCTGAVEGLDGVGIGAEGKDESAGKDERDPNAAVAGGEAVGVGSGRGGGTARAATEAVMRVGSRVGGGRGSRAGSDCSGISGIGARRFASSSGTAGCLSGASGALRTNGGAGFVVAVAARTGAGLTKTLFGAELVAADRDR